MRLFKDISSNLLFIGLVVFVSTALWSYAFFTKEIKTYKNVVSVIGVATKEATSDNFYTPEVVFYSGIVPNRKGEVYSARNISNTSPPRTLVKLIFTFSGKN